MLLLLKKNIKTRHEGNYNPKLLKKYFSSICREKNVINTNNLLVVNCTEKIINAFNVQNFRGKLAFLCNLMSFL